MTSEAAKYQIINNWPVQTGKKTPKETKCSKSRLFLWKQNHRH